MLVWPVVASISAVEAHHLPQVAIVEGLHLCPLRAHASAALYMSHHSTSPTLLVKNRVALRGLKTRPAEHSLLWSSLSCPPSACMYNAAHILELRPDCWIQWIQ